MSGGSGPDILEVQRVAAMLRPHSLENHSKIRVGGTHDGGYVLPQFARDSNFLISIGIGEEVSFDHEFAARGAKVYQFDHTIDFPAQSHSRIQFFKFGWGACGTSTFRTLRQIMDFAEWSSAKHPVLKFDVEGAEWISLTVVDVKDLNEFEVIVAELHNLEGLKCRESFDLIDAGLQKLSHGHSAIHVHGNNNACTHSLYGFEIPDVLEVTFVRNDCRVAPNYSLEEIPGPLDYPSNPVFPDQFVSLVPLGQSKFNNQSRAPKQFGINLFGQFSSSTGLGVTVRQTAQALIAKNIPLACCDIAPYYPSNLPSAELSEITPLFADDPKGLHHPVNLYCIPAIEFNSLISRMPWLRDSAKFQAGVVWWEATKLHPDWAKALCRFDALVAYSPFICNVLANNLPMTPTIAGRQPLFLPGGIKCDRETFGLPAESTVFITSLDPSSDIARKNPEAVIRAFRAAFSLGTENVRLILRLNNAQSSPMAEQATKKLFKEAEGEPRIGFSLQPLDYKEVLSLYRCADAFISLHRAEGLGLALLESMRLGLPVIATGWSGNMAFMDASCACLVRYQLIQTFGNHPFYQPSVLGPEAVWADPIIADAIAWMRHLHGHPDERQRIGRAGQMRAMTYQEEALQLSWITEIKEQWQHQEFLPPIFGKISSVGPSQR